MTILRPMLAGLLALASCTSTDVLAVNDVEVDRVETALLSIPWASVAPPAQRRQPEAEPTTDPLVLRLRDVAPGKGFMDCGFELDIEGLPAARDDGHVAYLLDFSPSLSIYTNVGLVFESSEVPEGTAFRTERFRAKLELFAGSELPIAPEQSDEEACESFRAAREAELAEFAMTMGNASRWHAMRRLPAQYWDASEAFADDDRATFRSIPANERPVQLAMTTSRLIARVFGVSLYFDVELPREDKTIIDAMWFDPHSRAGLIMFEELDRDSCDCSCDWEVSAYALVWPRELLEWAEAHPCAPESDAHAAIGCHVAMQWKD